MASLVFNVLRPTGIGGRNCGHRRPSPPYKRDAAKGRRARKTCPQALISIIQFVKYLIVLTTTLLVTVTNFNFYI